MEQKEDKTPQLNTEETFEGFIFLWRKITRSWLWRLEAEEIKIALLCLIKANHRDGEWFTGSKFISVNRGSFITSRDNFAVEVSGKGRKNKISPDKVYRTWEKLKKAHFLHTNPHNNFTVISIVNYEKYQSKPHNETTPTRTTTAQEVHTNNNDNNEKKVNKERDVSLTTQKHFSLNSLKEEDFESISQKYGVPVAFVRSKFDDLVNYCEAKGKRYKNYFAVLSRWVKDDAIKIRKEAVQNGSKRGIDARSIE